jgi:hypothetical protein
MWWRKGGGGRCSRVDNERCHRHGDAVGVEGIRELIMSGVTDTETQSEWRGFAS